MICEFLYIWLAPKSQKSGDETMNDKNRVRLIKPSLQKLRRSSTISKWPSRAAEIVEAIFGVSDREAFETAWLRFASGYANSAGGKNPKEQQKEDA